MHNLFKCIEVNVPCRIEIYTQETLDNIENLTKELSKKYDVSIEDPLSPSRDNGVLKIIFLDKYLLSEGKNIETWLHI